MCKRGCAWGLIGALLGAPGVTLALELVDPMQPPAAPPMAQEDEPAAARAVWRLRAIKVEAHRRSAMINGRMVAEGEEIDGARVVEIKPRTVVIAVGNETTSLSLLKHEIKTRSAATR